MSARWILIVEDEDAARDVICDTLTIAGCDAIGAPDGKRACELLEQRDELPCVIVLDLMMPGMNGWQFREWQQRHPRFGPVPVVVLSAVRGLRDEARRLNTDFLAKPVLFDALLDKVEQHCGECRAG